MHNMLVCDTKFFLFFFTLVFDDEVIEKYFIQAIQGLLYYHFESLFSRIIIVL